MNAVELVIVKLVNFKVTFYYEMHRFFLNLIHYRIWLILLGIILDGFESIELKSNLMEDVKVDELECS